MIANALNPEIDDISPAQKDSMWRVTTHFEINEENVIKDTWYFPTEMEAVEYRDTMRQEPYTTVYYREPKV